LGCISLDFKVVERLNGQKNPLSKKKSPEMAFWQSIERAVRIKNAINRGLKHEGRS
jgi:hypothetical protein